MLYYWDYLWDPFPSDETFMNVYFDGDSIYDSIHYHVIISQTFLYKYYSGSNLIIDDTLRVPEVYCLIREDTISRRLYILRNDFPTSTPYEDLLFDFNLNVGDTLKSLYYQYISGYPVIDSITSITLANGESRKMFYVYPYGSLYSLGQGYFIEGCGGGNGIIEPFSMSGLSGYQSYTWIICHKKDTIELLGSCDVHAGITTNKKKELLKIYPDPFENFITISGFEANPDVLIVQLFDSFGCHVYKKKITSGSLLNLYIPGLQSGLYILQIHNPNNGNHWSKKIIKI